MERENYYRSCVRNMLSGSRHDTGHGEHHGFRGISAQFVLHFQFFDGISTHLSLFFSFLFFSVLSLVLNTSIHADSILTLNLFKHTIHKEGGRGVGEKVVVGGKGLGRLGGTLM